MSVTRRDAVRDVVAQVAPHELVVIDGLRSLTDERVTRLLGRPAGNRDPLGFGVTDVTVLVTPIVWLVVDEVVNRGAGLIADSVIARFRAVLRRLFRRRAGAARTVPPLTPEQLDLVHGRVRERAATAGMADGAAESLADAVVSRLARASTSGTGPEPSGRTAH